MTQQRATFIGRVLARALDPQCHVPLQCRPPRATTSVDPSSERSSPRDFVRVLRSGTRPLIPCAGAPKTHGTMLSRHPMPLVASSRAEAIAVTSFPVLPKSWIGVRGRSDPGPESDFQTPIVLSSLPDTRVARIDECERKHATGVGVEYSAALLGSFRAVR